MSIMKDGPFDTQLEDFRTPRQLFKIITALNW